MGSDVKQLWIDQLNEEAERYFELAREARLNGSPVAAREWLQAAEAAMNAALHTAANVDPPLGGTPFGA